jgi:hypothetical protein
MATGEGPSLITGYFSRQGRYSAVESLRGANLNILETPPFSTIRRNHGIEHATVHVLTEHHPNVQLVGRADTHGFNIYGDVRTDWLESAAAKALERMQNGAGHLAVHPRCGTNLVVLGVLTAVAAILALGRKPSLKKIPDAILATTLAGFVAQPVGLKLQEYVTTSPDVMGARIVGIQQKQMGGLKIQHVDIAWE